MLPYRYRPRKCKHCRESFTPERVGQIVHESCVEPYVRELAKKKRAKEEAKRRADAKLERARIKARRRELETIPELIKAAQKEFNAYIRARDKDKPCICCGRLKEAPFFSSAGGDWDCGHYRSTGSASHLRFNEDNAHRQLKFCNRYKAGRAVDYRFGLIARIGLERVEALEADNEPHHWTREELREIRDTYKAKRKELEKA